LAVRADLDRRYEFRAADDPADMTPQISRAAEMLRAGGLVAFPTETVYGLGADASNPEAVARLYAAKRRPATHPVIVHFDTAAHAFEWAREVPQGARTLAAKFWPGPLTLILKRAERAKDFVTGGQDTVGLRVPSHPVAQALLKEFGGGVAAPSANVFGRVSATTAAHVREDLAREADLVLDAGASEIGIESTIVDLSGESPVLLRPGAISRFQLEECLNLEIRERSSKSPRHPGGHARHYAPKTPARLVPPHALDSEIRKSRAEVAVLAFSRPDERVDFWIRMPRDPKSYARRLYAALRELDEAGCGLILVEAPPEAAEWAAVHDRLKRATA
jgi:L-threonylcarbamoyladenylate synthase